MYQGLRGRIKELLFCKPRPQVREDPRNEVFKNSALRLRPVGRGDYEGRVRTPPPQALECHFFC